MKKVVELGECSPADDMAERLNGSAPLPALCTGFLEIICVRYWYSLLLLDNFDKVNLLALPKEPLYLYSILSERI